MRGSLKVCNASMVEATKQSLRFAEDLTLPKVQVVVMRANMSCNHCRQRVSGIISKMNGLVEYMVDMRKKEVTVRGIVDIKKRRKLPEEYATHMKKKKKLPCSLGLMRLVCCRAF